MNDFLLKLFHVELDGATRLSHISLGFRNGISVEMALLLLVLLGVGVFLAYQKISSSNLVQWKKFLLTGLRMLFLLLLIMGLLKPILTFNLETSVHQLFALLFDTSASMDLKDLRVTDEDRVRAAIGKGLVSPSGGLNQSLSPDNVDKVSQISRMDLAKGVFKNPKLEILPGLKKAFELVPYSFVSGANSQDGSQTNSTLQVESAKKSYQMDWMPWIEKLEGKAPNTAIGDSVNEVLIQNRGKPLMGILVVTDGANNSGQSPVDVAEIAREEGVPLFVYGIGIAAPIDIIVQDLVVKEVVFINDEAPVAVRVQGQGLAGKSATVVLKVGGQKVDEKQVLFGQEGDQLVGMKFKPTAVGDYDLEVSIEPRSDEIIKTNNSQKTKIRAVDTKIRVLYVEQFPRFEFKHLVPNLIRDHRLDFKCILLEADPEFSIDPKGPFIRKFPSTKEEWFKYDLIIWGDVNPKAVPPGQLENIEEFIAKFGGAFVMIAGKEFSPQAYLHTPIEKFLPVEFGSITGSGNRDENNVKPILFQVTASGLRNPMLKLAERDDENLKAWEKMPPIYWTAKVTRAKPGADVLMVDGDRIKETRFGLMPIMAVQPYGVGQTMFIGTDNLWRWRKNKNNKNYIGLWEKIIQRMVWQHLLGGAKQTQLSINKESFATGEKIVINARIYSKSFDPISDQTVKGYYSARGTGKERKEVVLRRLPDQPGMYRGEFVAMTPGAFKFVTERDAETSVDFQVVDRSVELRETGLKEKQMREMCRITGGEFYREEDLYKMVPAILEKAKQISAKNKDQAEGERGKGTGSIHSTVEADIWSSPLFLILILIPITIEWILRKKFQLK